MFQDSSNSRKGFSLIELMIAVLFFGIIATSLSLPVSNCLYLNTNNADINTANSLARSYLEDLKDAWKIRNNFDAGALIAIGSDYTAQDKYSVAVQAQTVQTNADGNVIVRRVNITYRDSNNNTLCNLSFDFNRPGNVNQAQM